VDVNRFRQVVGAEQGVMIAELQANAQVKQATGDAEGTVHSRYLKAAPKTDTRE
jgi:hypothetical protein